MSKEIFLENRSYRESEVIDSNARVCVQYTDTQLKDAKLLTQKAFPFLNQFSLKYDGNVFMFYNKGVLDGMIKGKLFTLKGKKIGVVSWLIVNPERQNGGLAGVMLEALLKRFEDDKCDLTLACTHSSNLASIRGVLYYGFESVSLSWQLKTFGFKIIKLWKESFHLFDFSHLLWVKTQAPLPKASFFPHMMFQCVVMCLSLLLHFQVGFSKSVMGALLLVVPALSSRYFISKWMLRKEKNVKFCPWESSNIVLLLANCFYPFWLPLHGGLIPHDSKFVSRKVKKGILVASFVSFAVMMLGVVAFSFYVPFQFLAKLLLVSLAIELFLPFFPFQSYAGSLLLNKNKILYLVMCILCVFLFLNFP